MDFINGFCEYTKAYESPGSFWKWSAYATVAAILRDSCYGRLGDIFVFPNIFVLLLADSAVHRKGNPVRFSEEFVGKVKNTKVISGRSSIQGILDELSRGETDQKTGKILAGGSALWSVPELSAGIVNDLEAVKILTDIYDFRPEYVSRLRGQGTFKIKNVCFTMLAASNEELLKSVYDTKAIFGGLLGRTFLIAPNEFRPANSLFNSNHREDTIKSLVGELEDISMLRGQFLFTPEAQDKYDKWYQPFRLSYAKVSDKSGVVGRIHTGILKLSMIICANLSKSLVVHAHHMEEAIEECLGLMPNYNTFLMSSGKSPLSDLGTIFLTELYDAPSKMLTRRKFLQKRWNDFDADVLDKIVNTLSQAGMIDQGLDGNDVTYRLTQKCVDKLFTRSIK